ncbi:type III secretion system stator protein SctL (plasmid) [Bosea vestrisii]|uniref:type III secretion system stator protein SctL n=1 Tax=Bosea vestrisii TaxID=151416 RepID=UPI0024DFA47B|nr:type III secretion system stator protein SctL [Bosea vestrisii]WID99707.1 type III secretion system stator protein SctL [Bosea vestrisii]
MTLETDTLPASPALRPLGPLVRAEEVGLWNDAAEARAATERHVRRVRSWARTAYERERARGHAEGRAAGAEEASRLVAGATAEAARQKAVLERELPDLVMEIVRDLLGAFDPGEMLIRTVRHAIEQKYGGGEVRLRVAPVHADALAREFAGCDGQEGRPLVRVEADPALSARQCVLWSEFGNIDLGLDAQLRALRLGFGLPSEEEGA